MCSKNNGTVCRDADLHFSVSATTMALTVDRDWMLYVWAATTFAPVGNVTLTAGAASAAPGGDLELGAPTSVLDAGTRAITAGGDWDNTAGGTLRATGDQLVTFTGVGTGFKLSGLMTGASSFRKGREMSDGPGDGLELLGGLRIVPGTGQRATFEVALLRCCRPVSASRST